MVVNLILEGHLEELVAKKIVNYCGHSVGTVHGQQGFGFIKTRAYKFHSMAREGVAVFVLTDFMDAKCDCVVEACTQYLLSHVPQPNNNYILRFAVRELESWLLADREGLSQFLGVSLNRIPTNPDIEVDPKQKLVSIANRSRKTRLKIGIVPDAKHKGAVAPGYLGVMNSFVRDQWDIERAMSSSDSLSRCVARLKNLS